MKIGVWLGSEAVKTVGGGSSYRTKFLKLIDEYTFSEDVEVCYLSIVSQPYLKKEVINISQIPSVIYRLFSFSYSIIKYLKIVDAIIIRKKSLKKVLRGTGVKIAFFPTQWSYLDPDFPFISNNWDIGHRSTHSFPEVTCWGRFESRERFYRYILPKALLIICESETGKKELIDYAGLGNHKIRVMPMFAGAVSETKLPEKEMVTILQNIGIEKYRYFYYPAQFWAHKNHIGLLKAFKAFSEKIEGYKMVFSGNDPGNREYIKRMASEMGLSNDVLFLGFVKDEEVYTLYSNASCLIMASHFGPTNMPPIEAMELGCPVLCSDLGGHREILGEGALYFNSYDSHSIFEAMVKLVKNREEYVCRINAQKKVTHFNPDYAMRQLDDIFRDAINIRENWE